jgi:hypothetical protein
VPPLCACRPSCTDHVLQRRHIGSIERAGAQGESNLQETEVKSGSRQGTLRHRKHAPKHTGTHSHMHQAKLICCDSSLAWDACSDGDVFHGIVDVACLCLLSAQPHRQCPTWLPWVMQLGPFFRRQSSGVPPLTSPTAPPDSRADIWAFMRTSDERDYVASRTPAPQPAWEACGSQAEKSRMAGRAGGGQEMEECVLTCRVRTHGMEFPPSSAACPGVMSPE